MGRGEEAVAAGGHWLRVVAHVAIVVVFVVSALGYAPFRDGATSAQRAQAVQPLAGVRSAIWLDAANLAVTVDGPANRSMAMIDRVCAALAPVGGSLGVVVHVEDATATTTAAALARRCDVPAGQLAFIPKPRESSDVSPRIRGAFEADEASAAR